MKINILIYSILFILLSYSSNAKKYIIGVEEADYYPHYVFKSEAIKGSFAKELFDKFIDNIKVVTFELKPLPINRLYMDLLQENIDFKYPDNPYWQQKLKEEYDITYSDRVVKIIDGVWVKKENKGKGIDNVLNLGSILGFTINSWRPYIDSKKVTVVYNTKYVQSLNQLLYGRVDGVYANYSSGSNLIKNVIKTDQLVFDSSLPYDISGFYLSTLNYINILDVFNKFMRDNKDMIQDLKNKYKVEQKLPE